MPLGLIFLIATVFTGCKDNAAKPDMEQFHTEDKQPTLKISLAQWSLHSAIGNNSLNPLDFSEKAKVMGFEGIEYVSGQYSKKLESMGMAALQDSLKSKSAAHGIENVLILIDGEGGQAASDKMERDQAFENYKKWVDAAQFLGCHSIRVNLFV